jgi:hypothetical protein
MCSQAILDPLFQAEIIVIECESLNQLSIFKLSRGSLLMLSLLLERLYVSTVTDVQQVAPKRRQYYTHANT